MNFAYQYAAYLRNQDLVAAAVAVRETEALALELIPRDDHLGWLYVFLGNALVALDKGRTAEAADLFSRIADIGVKEWGPTDPQLLSIYQNNAILLSRLGRSEQAVEVALKAEDNQAYSDAGELGYQQALVARLMFEASRTRDAEIYYRDALVTLGSLPEAGLNMARAQRDLATLLSVGGEHAEATALTRAAMAVYSELEITAPERLESQGAAAMEVSQDVKNQSKTYTSTPLPLRLF